VAILSMSFDATARRIGTAYVAHREQFVDALSALDAHDRARLAAPETVERAARSIFDSKNIHADYASLQDEKKDDFRRYARAALAALTEAK
jgi:hypothetical protein